LISGEIVAEDRLEDVVKERRSYTGKYLKDLLGQKAGTEGGSGGVGR
jgi:excinuclease UvrABC ATPase subunit